MKLGTTGRLPARQANRGREALAGGVASAVGPAGVAARSDALQPAGARQTVAADPGGDGGGSVCGEEANPWPAACAVEMIHAYSLIHDDLPAMDDDDLRRGLPTCHKKFGEALAILAGDALLTLAFQVLAEGYPAGTARRPAAGSWRERLGRPAWSADRSMTWPGNRRGERNVEGLEYLHLRKTGALIRAEPAAGGAGGLCSPDKVLRRPELLEHWTAMAAVSVWLSRSPMICSTSRARRADRQARRQGRGPWQTDLPGFLGVAESRRRAERLGREACEHLEPLGTAAGRLRALVSFVLDRDR